MKNLITYLSKKSLSLGIDSGMTRFSLVSLICLCLLTLGAGKAWGTTIFQEGFGDNGKKTTAYGSATCFTATTAMFTTGSASSNYSGSGSVGKGNYSSPNYSSGYTGATGKSGCYHTGTASVTSTIIQISNIKITGYSDLHLSFGVLGGSNSHKINVYYKIDSGSKTQIISNGSLLSTSWSLKEADISGSGTNLTLYFEHTPSKAWTIRLDDITVTGTAAAVTYTVSYAAGGASGTVPTSHTGVSSGSNITLKSPDNLTAPAGKTFGGWNDGSTTYAAGTSYTVTGNKTMTAVWSCITPTISSQSIANASYTVGQSPVTALSVTATGGTLSYQWQSSSTENGTYSNVAGATSSSFTPPVTAASDLWYKCVVTNTGSSCNTTVTSNKAHIVVSAGSTWKFKYSGDGYTARTMTEAAGIASYSLDLAADTRYEFGFDDNGSAFYKNQGTIITTTSGWVFNTSDNNCKIHTGPAGTYTFAINTTSKAVTVTYPSVSHPNEHYVYFKNTDSWGTVKGYLGNTGNDNKAAAWPGSDMQVTTEICGENYYYAALNAMSGTYNVIVFNNGSGSKTSDLSTAGLGKFNANQDANWHDFKYSITFAGNGNTGGSMSNVSNICVGSDQTLASNGYTKTHYHFTGWIANVDVKIGGATVTAGTLITNAATIQDIHSNITLTAQWAPDEYTISTTLSHVTSSPAIPSSYTYTGSAAGLTYTISADAGYRLPTSITVTGTTYTWNSNTGVLTLTGTITSNVSITITAVQTHTVTWLSNGSNYVTPVVYDNGAELALPAGTPSAPGGCSDKVFVGWTSDPEISTETSTKPTIISAGGAVTGGATYRAVFADQVGDPDHFKRVTQLSDIAEGGEIVFGFYVTSNTKLCGLDFSGWTTYSCATGVTETSSKIPVPSDANIWTVSKESGYWVFTNKGDGTTKLATSSSSSNKELDPKTQTYYKWNIGASSSGTNNFYVQLYNGSSLTNCALELYESTWKIYAPYTGSGSSKTYTYASNAYTALKLYVPAGSEDNYITLCSTCTTPSDVTASGITTDGATITWNGTSQENNGGSGTGFVVKYGTNSTRDENSNTINVAAGTNTADLTGLAQGTKYYVWVQSKCDNSWSTTPAEFTTLVSHTATFIGADGSTLQSSAIVEGESVTYSGSTPVSCDTGDGASTTFVGWATDTWEDKVAKGSIVPTFIDIAGGESLPAMSTSDVTYHAVFAKSSGTPLTNHAWTYTFTAQTFKSDGTKTLAGTDGGDAVNADWTTSSYNTAFSSATYGSYDASRGCKIGSTAGETSPYTLELKSYSFTGTITAVKVSTSGNSGVNGTVTASVGGTSFTCDDNVLTSSNEEYTFSGNKVIDGNAIQFYWEQDYDSPVPLYIKKIEVDYTTGGDVSYSNYMTTCSQCVTPNSVTADAITEAGATINWAGTSKTGTTGFTVLWGTDGTRANNSNSANVDADTKTYSITGLSAGTTYYVWVQSRCDDSWSDRISFTTLAIHDVTFTNDDGTLSVVSPVGVVDGQTLTFPNVTSTSCGTFVGWKVTEVSDYDNVAAPSPLYKYNDTKENITADESYQAVYRTATGAETNVTDNWTGTKIGVSIYSDWTGRTDATAAVYAGNTTKNSTFSNCIQMRNSDACGIVTTTSGGLAKKVTITWNSNTTNDKALDIYGKNTPYSSSSDLYNNENKGTKLGSITKGSTTELTITGDYAYIGIRCSDNGARYIDNIAIQWYGTPMSYMTAPTCDATVGITASFSAFTYVYGSGPSAAQSFMVSGINLSEALVVTAPTNYEVCKTADGTYTSSVSFTPAAGKVSAETVYIRLAAGLNVGTYNYDAANGVSVASNSATPQTAALNGSVTKAAGTIAFTDFNAVDHYEAELEKGMSDIDVTLTVSVTGDGSVSYSKSPAAGVSPTIPATQPTTTLHVLQPGIWTVTATLTAGTNYTGANTNCEVRVKRVDTYVDFIHNKTIKEYSSGATVVDGKMSDWGSGYTVPKIDDNATETSGSCQQTHFKFIGWVSEDDINIVDGTFKPGYTIVTAGTEEKRSTSKTYYAIWAKLED